MPLAKAMAPGLAEQTDLGHLLAEEALGHGGHGVHMDERGIAGAPQDEIDQRDVVDHGIGIGHADDGGDAAGGGGTARRGQRLAVLVAGLAGKDHHVDEAGREHVAAAIDDLGIADGARRDVRPEIGNEAVSDQHAAVLIEAGGGIDQPCIDKSDGRERGRWS